MNGAGAFRRRSRRSTLVTEKAAPSTSFTMAGASAWLCSSAFLPSTLNSLALNSGGVALEVGEHLLFALHHLVLRLEAPLDVDADLRLGQVFHVAHRGLHRVARPKVLLDRLRLGGRLDDHQRAQLAGLLGRGALLS